MLEIFQKKWIKQRFQNCLERLEILNHANLKFMEMVLVKVLGIFSLKINKMQMPP